MTTVWILVIVYITLLNIKSLESKVFSSVSHKTTLPLLFYGLFLVSELLPAIITAIKPRRFASKFLSIDNSATVEDSKAFMITQYHSSVDARAPRVSHVNVDYVALETVAATSTDTTEYTLTHQHGHRTRNGGDMYISESDYESDGHYLQQHLPFMDHNGGANAGGTPTTTTALSMSATSVNPLATPSLFFD